MVCAARRALVNIMTKFVVGKPFPVPAPRQEGAYLELWQDGLTLIIQFPGLNNREKKAFQRGIVRYSYLETQTDVPIPVWAFEFPKPFNAVDCNFNVLKVNPEVLNAYLEPEEGQLKNALHIYLLDGQILRGAKLFGLQPEAVQLFQATIRKQMSLTYSQIDFDRSLRQVHQYTTEQLMSKGRIFE